MTSQNGIAPIERRPDLTRISGIGWAESPVGRRPRSQEQTLCSCRVARLHDCMLWTAAVRHRLSFRARQDAGKQSDVCLHAVSPSRGSGQTRNAAHVEHSAEAFFGVR
jgi:hypothetical protein